MQNENIIAIVAIFMTRLQQSAPLRLCKVSQRRYRLWLERHVVSSLVERVSVCGSGESWAAIWAARSANFDA